MFKVLLTITVFCNFEQDFSQRFPCIDGILNSFFCVLTVLTFFSTDSQAFPQSYPHIGAFVTLKRLAFFFPLRRGTLDSGHQV